MGESRMLVVLCAAMFHCSQDLNVLIIHEVVLRYANMNYLTSEADLLLCITLSSVSVYPLILSSVLPSAIQHTGSKAEISSQNSIFFLEPSPLNNLGLSGFLSLPLCLSATSVSPPLQIFSFLTISMCFVWVLSAFVFEAGGDTQALVRWTFDEETAHKNRQRQSL